MGENGVWEYSCMKMSLCKQYFGINSRLDISLYFRNLTLLFCFLLFFSFAIYPKLFKLLLCFFLEVCKSSLLFSIFCISWWFAAAAATAKSLQLCLTLCDPIDDSPPGSSVPGIFQARILEWVAISFSSAWKWKVKVRLLSCVWLFTTPQTAAYQAPPSMEFSRQEYWSGSPVPSPSWWFTHCVFHDIFYHGLLVCSFNLETHGFPRVILSWIIFWVLFPLCSLFLSITIIWCGSSILTLFFIFLYYFFVLFFIFWEVSLTLSPIPL